MFISDHTNTNSQNLRDRLFGPGANRLFSGLLSGNTSVPGSSQPLETSSIVTRNVQSGLSLSMSALAPAGGATSLCLSRPFVNSARSGNTRSTQRELAQPLGQSGFIQPSSQSSGVVLAGATRAGTPPPSSAPTHPGTGQPTLGSPGLSHLPIVDVNSFALFPPEFQVTLAPLDIFLGTKLDTITTIEAAHSALKCYAMVTFKLPRDGIVVEPDLHRIVELFTYLSDFCMARVTVDDFQLDVQRNCVRCVGCRCAAWTHLQSPKA